MRTRKSELPAKARRLQQINLLYIHDPDRASVANLGTCKIAAENFVSSYYQAINSRAKLETFYINSSTRYNIPADISINGSVIPTPAEYSKLLETQGENVLYEIESLDTHIINPSFQYGAPDNVYESDKNEKSGRKMSIVVTTMGKVRFGKGREAPQKMFNETFVLVPNWDAMARNPARGLKRWLIMSQNFRAL